MTDQVIVCPQCSQPVVNHCDGPCNWLVCTRCKVIFGEHAFILYGEAKDREVEAKRRQNGG